MLKVIQIIIFPITDEPFFHTLQYWLTWGPWSVLRRPLRQFWAPTVLRWEFGGLSWLLRLLGLSRSVAYMWSGRIKFPLWTYIWLFSWEFRLQLCCSWQYCHIFRWYITVLVFVTLFAAIYGFYHDFYIRLCRSQMSWQVHIVTWIRVCVISPPKLIVVRRLLLGIFIVDGTHYLVITIVGWGILWT